MNPLHVKDPMAVSSRASWQHPALRCGVMLLLCLLLRLVPMPAMAANPVFTDSGQSATLGDVGNWALALGDVDGDGDLDIFAGTMLNSRGHRVWLNSDRGIFSDTGQVLGQGQSDAVALGDLDGDGDLDAFVAVRGIDEVWLNDGTGVFTQAIQPALAQHFDSTYAVALADLDGDGHLDAVTVGCSGTFIWLNNGAGEFANSDVKLEGGCPGKLTVADVNGDGLPDLFFNRGLRLHNGKDTEGRINFSPMQTFEDAGANIEDVAVGDLDSDGDLDIFGASDGRRAVIIGLNQGNLVFVFSETEFATVGGEGGGQAGHVALGDLDGDNDLDAVIVSHSRFVTRVFVNNGGGQFQVAQTLLPVEGRAVALGDLDHDGDLDIYVATDQEDQVWLNNGGGLYRPGATLSVGPNSRIVAMGDTDNNGSLDLLVGLDNGEQQIFVNDGTGVFTPRILPAQMGGQTLIDLNGDGRLDLFAVEANAFVIWLDNGSGGYTGQSQPVEGDMTGQPYALGDLDGDGDLDLRVGAKLWANNGSGSFIDTQTSIDISLLKPGWLYDVQAIALGDLDNDGDLDMVILTSSGGAGVWLNLGGFAFSYTGRPFGDSFSEAYALGDLNGDGYLDLITSDRYQDRTDRVWFNDGAGNFIQNQVLKPQDSYTHDIDLVDLDGDGDLDAVIVGSSEHGNVVWLNVGAGVLALGEMLRPRESNGVHSVFTGDFTGDGAPDIVIGIELGVHTRHWAKGGGSTRPKVTIRNPDPTGAAMANASATILDDPVIPITYSLVDPAGRPIGRVAGFYSLNGGDSWLPATPTTETQTANLPTSTSPTAPLQRTYHWDTFASGFFGNSDNVVFRLEAYLQLEHTDVANSYDYTDLVAGPYQWVNANATTTPFRVRGTQVRVFANDAQPGNEVADAFVFRLPAGQLQQGEPIGGMNRPNQTDATGYLSGRGAIHPGDLLVALAPVTETASFAVYNTNILPTVSGLDAFEVGAPGVQEVVVSANNPLILFHLDVALEWDARKDTQFMAQLEYDLKRASQLVFDLTNGQAALGYIRIFHDARRLPALEENDWQPWLDAHVRIYATNRMRPSAALGGITTDIVVESNNANIVYAPGQVQMGAVWNRYGETSGSLGEDWPLTLAHELGHYLFYLDENYLGLDANGVLVQVNSCPGIMANPYREDYTEFHPDADWDANCLQTLSQHELGRSDWQTIALHYPWLRAPVGQRYAELNPGPNTLPLAVTQLEVYSVENLNFDQAQHQPDVVTVVTGTVATEQTLNVPIFYFYRNGVPYHVDQSARAYLLQDGWLLDLGRPHLGEVVARGARPGDRLCVFELQAARTGCETIADSDNQLEIVDHPGWLPDIRISPVTSDTIAVTVAGLPAGLALQARHYSANLPAGAPINLNAAGNGYSGVFTLVNAAQTGYVHIWAQNDPEDRRREAIVDYALGGSPGYAIGRGGYAIGRGGYAVGRGGYAIGRGGYAIGRGGYAIGRGGYAIGRGGYAIGRHAPAISADGQVVIIGDNVTFDPGQFYTLQSATLLPGAPSYATVVGNGYWLTASGDAPGLDNRGPYKTSISFQYLGAEVPPGEENFLRIYFWDGSAGAVWQPLPTLLDPQQNFAAAATQGPGLYALMSSIEISLPEVGWNLISYPVQEKRSIVDALASIAGHYTVVYSYNANEPTEPWQVYAVDAPDYVNSLREMEFGRGYWIKTTQPLMLYLKGGNTLTAANAVTFPQPPATLYGQVQSGPGFSPSAGLSVQAHIDGVRCGQSRTREFNGAIVYVVHVSAGDLCGASERTISLTIGDQTLENTTLWQNDGPTQVIFVPVSQPARSDLYLPMISTQ